MTYAMGNGKTVHWNSYWRSGKFFELLPYADTLAKATSDLGRTDMLKYTICTGETQPICQAVRHIPPCRKVEVIKLVKKMLDKILSTMNPVIYCVSIVNCSIVPDLCLGSQIPLLLQIWVFPLVESLSSRTYNDSIAISAGTGWLDARVDVDVDAIFEGAVVVADVAPALNQDVNFRS